MDQRAVGALARVGHELEALSATAKAQAPPMQRQPIEVEYPLEARPLCLNCHKRMKPNRNASHQWRCVRCGVNCAIRLTDTSKRNYLADYPKEKRPKCPKCDQPYALRLRAQRPHWLCTGCKTHSYEDVPSSPGISIAYAPRARRKLKRRRSPAPRTEVRPGSLFADVYPADVRPWSRCHHKRMVVTGVPPKRRWQCPTCGESALFNQIPRERANRERALNRAGRVSEWPMASRPCCITCRFPFYYSNTPRGVKWVCGRCPNTSTYQRVKYYRPGMDQAAQKQAARERFPVESRPYCIACRNRMTVNAGGSRAHKKNVPPMYECARHKKKISCAIHRGGIGHRISYCKDNPVAVPLDKFGLPVNAEHIAPESRPWCAECRSVMGVAGSKTGRRWQCRSCSVSVLRVSAGDKVGVKNRYVVPERTPEYIEALYDISDDLSRVIRQHGGEEFNAQLVRLNRAIKFYALNSEADNRAAVATEIDGGLVTLEELADVIPLSEDHIKIICNQLVNATGSRFEWRPIGFDARHGARQFGIFQKDAPRLRERSRYDPLKYSIHYEHVAALDDLSAHVKKLEAKARREKTALPWDTKIDTERRQAGLNTGFASVLKRVAQ